MALMTAMPEAPASIVDGAFLPFTPPIDTTGIFTASHTFAKPSTPITSASSLELIVTPPRYAHIVGNTAPEPR